MSGDVVACRLGATPKSFVSNTTVVRDAGSSPITATTLPAAALGTNDGAMVQSWRVGDGDDLRIRAEMKARTHGEASRSLKARSL
jgi:hypothetical protein